MRSKPCFLLPHFICSLSSLCLFVFLSLAFSFLSSLRSGSSFSHTHGALVHFHQMRNKKMMMMKTTLTCHWPRPDELWQRLLVNLIKNNNDWKCFLNKQERWRKICLHWQSIRRSDLLDNGDFTEHRRASSALDYIAMSAQALISVDERVQD